MAIILTKNRRFTVEFDARTAEGKVDHFQSSYTPTGKPIALRKRDTRSLRDRYMQRYKDRGRTTQRQGIYEVYSLGGYLVFVDKLASEDNVFLNWRGRGSQSYRRIPL